jgi:two-component system, NarL family, sensor histidine kinase DesK
MGVQARHEAGVAPARTVRHDLSVGLLAADADADTEFSAISRRRARIGVVLGLLFLAGPVSDLLDSSLGTAHLAALLIGLCVFVALYLSLLPPSPWLERRGPGATLLALGLLIVIAIALLLGGAPTSFAALFVYFVAAAGMRLPPRAAVAVTLLTALGAGSAGWVHGDSRSAVAATVLTILSIGVLMTAFGRIARANHELRATREELARLAVSEERLRIARDLHDLLGHSLSVIALKSELARKLVEREPTRAAAELDDIQSVTRTALAEVRDAVQGYRRLALAEALESAQIALAAAGIDCALADADVALPADVDAVLAWAVREGTTNVIRHSGALHCAIRVRADSEQAAVEIEDDGSAASATGRGSGLNGLRERAHRVRGELEAGSLPGGGFRLRLTVPLAGA